ncbi:hypothetical protein [Chlorobaculum parvum]|uniref:hypothetical protein n=1 Tax=Chlorobaculum parvum TaxID=274539 RepID=UPI0012EA24D9|nr:hypothetical protein [Chlorobaculum parvum]
MPIILGVAKNPERFVAVTKWMLHDAALYSERQNHLSTLLLKLRVSAIGWERQLHELVIPFLKQLCIIIGLVACQSVIPAKAGIHVLFPDSGFPPARQ